MFEFCWVFHAIYSMISFCLLVLIHTRYNPYYITIPFQLVMPFQHELKLVYQDILQLQAQRSFWVWVSQWVMTLQCNVISHWLSPYQEWSLILDNCSTHAWPNNSLKPRQISCRFAHIIFKLFFLEWKLLYFNEVCGWWSIWQLSHPWFQYWLGTI